jgi:hypothetical protein
MVLKDKMDALAEEKQNKKDILNIKGQAISAGITDPTILSQIGNAKSADEAMQILGTNMPSEEKGMVMDLASKYVDAGITLKDSLATAQAKLKNSRIYQDQVGAGVGGGGTGGGVDGGGIVTDASGNSYDIASYATDPTHETKVQSILKNIGQMTSWEQMDSYIQRVAPGSKVTGEMIGKAAEKYGVSWEMMMAIMQQDSSFGTAGKGARTFNPGNVGNTDSGAEVNYGDWQSGVDAVAKNLSGRKTTATSGLSSRAEAVYNNPMLINQYTATEKGKIIDEISNAGLDPSGLVGKALSDTAIKEISQTQDALDSLNDLMTKIKDNKEYIGPIKGLAYLNPWSKARKVLADIDRIRQTVGKALGGGVLRKEDEEKYKKILATITDTPETAEYKIVQLIADINSNLKNYATNQGLSGRYVDSSILNSVSSSGQSTMTDDEAWKIYQSTK